jgi:hypothetical protein
VSSGGSITDRHATANRLTQTRKALRIGMATSSPVWTVAP